MNQNIFLNADPEVHGRMPDRIFTEEEFNEGNLPFDSREIFDNIRDIKDPEHALSLEELGVVELDLVKVDNETNTCYVEFKPTIPHCTMATLIGLCLKVHLIRILPTYFKVDVSIVPGTHASYEAINKQLADKERVAAALENVYLIDVLNDCIMSEPQTLPKFVETALQKLNKLDHSKVLYIQQSRQHIESYRRWQYVLDSIRKDAL